MGATQKMAVLAEVQGYSDKVYYDFVRRNMPHSRCRGFIAWESSRQGCIGGNELGFEA